MEDIAHFVTYNSKVYNHLFLIAHTSCYLIIKLRYKRKVLIPSFSSFYESDKEDFLKLIGKFSILNDFPTVVIIDDLRLQSVDCARRLITNNKLLICRYFIL